jgi:hypothetical protein
VNFYDPKLEYRIQKNDIENIINGSIVIRFGYFSDLRYHTVSFAAYLVSTFHYPFSTVMNFNTRILLAALLSLPPIACGQSGGAPTASREPVFYVSYLACEKETDTLPSRADSLSLCEMFMIAATFERGSDACDRLFEVVARIYPASDQANINAAASALERGDTVAAALYLDRVGDRSAAWWNNAGVLAWLKGERQKAAECFAKGGVQGVGNAIESEKIGVVDTSPTTYHHE